MPKEEIVRGIGLNNSISVLEGRYSTLTWLRSGKSSVFVNSKSNDFAILFHSKVGRAQHPGEVLLYSCFIDHARGGLFPEAG
jgi:hypothetical protein